jgi:N6-adenosine-specific RNA methylase IME4
VSKFSTIIADPNWCYQNFADTAHGAAIASYETASTEDICAIPVGDFAARDAILLLWATWPKLEDAQRVIKAWGFSYVTGCPWVKTLPKAGDIYTGIGFWFQSASEMLLVCRRGNPKRKKFPILGFLEGEPRQFYAPKSRAHSQKPVEIHKWAEATCPGPYLELWATRETPGWTCYGLSLGTRLTPNGVENVTPVAHKT